MNVSVNGENPYKVSNEIYPDMCGTGWQEWILPALSVQPLVENAVKHGICQKEEGGGTVILTVKDCPDCYEVIALEGLVSAVKKAEASANIYSFRKPKEALEFFQGTPCEVVLLE